MAAEMSDRTRWQPIIARAVAAGTVHWQHASLAIGLVGLALVGVRGPHSAPAICLVLSTLQSALVAGGLWLSLRLRIDAVLFRALAEADSTDGFDRGMVELGLLDEGKANRPMSDRVAGLMRMVRLLALLVAAQLVLLVAAGWLAWR